MLFLVSLDNLKRAWLWWPTRMRMTCSGSKPPTGFPLTSTNSSPGWRRPETHTCTHKHTQISQSYVCIHFVSPILSHIFSPLRSASPPWITRAMKMPPVSSSLLMVAPWQTRTHAKTHMHTVWLLVYRRIPWYRVEIFAPLVQVISLSCFLLLHLNTLESHFRFIHLTFWTSWSF